MTFTPDTSIRSDADDLRELADLLLPSQVAIAIALRAIAVSVERRERSLDEIVRNAREDMAAMDGKPNNVVRLPRR